VIGLFPLFRPDLSSMERSSPPFTRSLFHRTHLLSVGPFSLRGCFSCEIRPQSFSPRQAFFRCRALASGSSFAYDNGPSVGVFVGYLQVGWLYQLASLLLHSAQLFSQQGVVKHGFCRVRPFRTSRRGVTVLFPLLGRFDHPPLAPDTSLAPPRRGGCLWSSTPPFRFFSSKKSVDNASAKFAFLIPSGPLLVQFPSM